MSQSKNVVDLRKQRLGWKRKFSPLSFSPRKKQRDSLHARRRRARLIAAAAAFALIFALAGAVSYVAHVPRLNVQSFVVDGVAHMVPETIETYAFDMIHDDAFHFFPPSNIFLYGPKRLEERIVEHFPRIKEAHVKKESLFSTTVHINVKEREPFAKWCRGGGIETAVSSSTPRECYVLDDGGFIFARTDGAENSATSYVFSGGVASSTAGGSLVGQLFAPSRMDGILALLQLLQESGFRPIGAEVENTQDFSIPLESSFSIKVPFDAHAEDLIKNLMLVLESERLKGRETDIEYIDLRFGNKVYFKFKGGVISNN